MAAIVVVVVLALVGVAGFFGYRALKQWKADREAAQVVVEDYPGPGNGSVQFTVDSGSDWHTVAQNLTEQDIIKSPEALTSIAGNSTLYPGTFSLQYQMKASDVLAVLSDQAQAGGFIEVRPGERVSDVIANAAQVTGLPESDFPIDHRRGRRRHPARRGQRQLRGAGWNPVRTTLRRGRAPRIS